MYIIGYETDIKDDKNNFLAFMILHETEDYDSALLVCEDIVTDTLNPHSDKIITILEVVGNVSKAISAKVELRDKFVK